MWISLNIACKISLHQAAASVEEKHYIPKKETYVNDAFKAFLMDGRKVSGFAWIHMLLWNFTRILTSETVSNFCFFCKQQTGAICVLKRTGNHKLSAKPCVFSSTLCWGTLSSWLGRKRASHRLESASYNLYFTRTQGKRNSAPHTLAARSQQTIFCILFGRRYLEHAGVEAAAHMSLRAQACLSPSSLICITSSLCSNLKF